MVIGSKQMVVFEDSRADNKLMLYDKGIELKNGGHGGRQAAGDAGHVLEPTNRCARMPALRRLRSQSEQRRGRRAKRACRVLQVLQACQRSLQMNGEPVQVLARPGRRSR